MEQFVNFSLLHVMPTFINEKRPTKQISNCESYITMGIRKSFHPLRLNSQIIRTERKFKQSSILKPLKFSGGYGFGNRISVKYALYAVNTGRNKPCIPGLWSPVTWSLIECMELFFDMPAEIFQGSQRHYAVTVRLTNLTWTSILFH